MQGISRYDQSAQAQFMNTYSPIPFQEILQAGQSKQNQYNTNRMGFEQSIAETQNLNYIPNSEDENYITSLRSTLEGIRDNYIDKDYSDPEIVRQIYSDVRKNVDRNRISKIQKSFEGYTKDMDTRRKLQSEGRYADYLAFDPKGYDSRSGIYDYNTPAALDFRKKAETYFDDLKGSSYLGNDGQIHEYINETTIAKTAKGSLQSFLESQEGQQKMIELDKRGIKGKDAESAAYDYLKEVGKEQLYSKITGFGPGYGSEDETELSSGVGNTQALQNKNINPNNPLKGTALNNISFDKEGNPLTYKNYGPDNSPPSRLQMITQSTSTGQYIAPMKMTGVDETIKKSQLKLLDDIGNYTIDNFGNTPLKEAKGPVKVAAFQQARQNLARIDNNKALIENSNLKKTISDNVLSDIKSRLLFPTEADEPVEITTIDNLFKKSGVKRESGDQVTVNGIVPGRGTYDVSIRDKDGFPKSNFEVSLNNNEREDIMPLIKAQEIHIKGVPGVKSFEVGNQLYLVATSIQPVYDRNGKIADYRFVSNVGPVENDKPNKDGTYNYIEQPISLDELDAKVTDSFRQLYSGKRKN